MSELLAFRGYPSSPSECDHDWRLNPVVVATATGGDRELWTCAKCRAQMAGPPMQAWTNRPVVWNDPATWEHRARQNSATDSCD